MPAQPTPGAYTLDPTRSSVRFQHKGMWGLATVNGTFGTVRGSGAVAEDGTGSGTLVIEVTSLDTKNARRDKDLLSKRFLEAGTYPEITFEAARIVNAADGSAQVEGELTVHGNSRKVSFPARYEVPGADSVALHGELTVERAEYGLTSNPLGMLSGAAKIELELVFSAAH
jgi:polyisoprenoid-binding protein YceI